MTARAAGGWQDAMFCARSIATPTGTWLAFGRAGDIFAALPCPPVRGRERCDNRLSYSNIGDEQLTDLTSSPSQERPKSDSLRF
jgi:hypothetical protein